MYCSSCGTEVTRELRYCNRCGANLNQPSAALPEQPVRQVNLTVPTISIAVMVIIGIIVIFASIADLARKDINPAALTWMVIGGLAAIVGVAALLMRQWTQLAGVIKQKEPRGSSKKAADNEYAPAQLPPFRSEPVSSVTDHTTRTFDPAKVRKS
jgi:hypothetical protein